MYMSVWCKKNPSKPKSKMTTVRKKKEEQKTEKKSRKKTEQFIAVINKNPFKDFIFFFDLV